LLPFFGLIFDINIIKINLLVPRQTDKNGPNGKKTKKKLANQTQTLNKHKQNGKLNGKFEESVGTAYEQNY
jgi:hypothetical protein